ncbi:MAG TPA: SCP2 sterol-binding domain-containing protein, partial [Acidimicrobiia bacterium]|nr:SCP2 sterol-binding domain-containing protein [Acidimicrobiia bacterium]
HRWDAETAAGRVFDVEPDLAADSVDEFLEHSTPSLNDDIQPLAGSLHLHATDIEGEWLIGEDEEGQLKVERGHNKGDAALRATASNLLLMLYRRIGTERGEIMGDAGVVDRFLARTNLD